MTLYALKMASAMFIHGTVCNDCFEQMLESLGRAFSRKKTRTNSISEAELEAAETRASFVCDSDALSPTQLSPGPGSFKRSFTLPTKLNPDHLDPDQRTSSAEDSDCLLSP